MRTQSKAAHLEYQVPKQVSEIFADTFGNGPMTNSDDLIAVAGDPYTAPEVLRQRAQDKGFWVRDKVALNPSMPPEVLVKLAQDEDFEVCYRVAYNLFDIGLG